MDNRNLRGQEPLTGKHCFDDLFESHPDVPRLVDMEGRTPFKLTCYRPGAIRSAEWFSLTIYPHGRNAALATGAVVHVRDITEYKETEARLADEVSQRRILLDQSRDGIVVLDQNGKVFEANQRYADMLGYSLEAVHQLHVWDWDDQWSETELKQMIETVDQSGDHFETSHRRRDGSRYDVEISTNGVVFGGEKLILCICRDITERKRAERERERLIGELRSALKAIKTLEGILPLCTFCKRIRNANGNWEPVDIYIHHHSAADVSHSICPDCMREHYPDECD